MKLARSLLLAFAACLFPLAAAAQIGPGSDRSFPVASCGTAPTPYTAGSFTVDATGLLCSSATISGSISIGTVNQGTGGASPWVMTGSGTAGSAATGVLTVQGIASMTPLLANATLSAETTKVIGTVNQGTSPWIVAGGGTAGSAATGVATVQGIASMTPLLVNPGTAANFGVVAQASTTSGQSGNLTQCAVTTAAPTYTTAQTDPLSCDTAGNLRTSATFSGTVGVTQSTSPWIVAGGGTAGIAATGVVTVQGIASMTKLLVTPDSVALPANQSVNVSQFGGTNVVTGTGASGNGVPRVTVSNDSTVILGAGAATIGALSANQSVNVAQVGGTNTVNGGVAGSQSVGGTVATNVAITANPLNLGAQAVSSENAAVTTARQVQLVADLVGKLIVLPYANPENFVTGTISSAMTGTTSTSLIAAPAAGLRNYVTQCTFSNSHATVGTMMILQDGSGGTTIFEAPAAPAFGGAAITFPTPLRQPTTATALFVQNVTTGANTFASCNGYKGA